MRIFVTGASGYIGGSVATTLVRAGHEVRGLVRTEKSANAVRALGLTPVLGTLDDGDLLCEEAHQSDGVVNAADSDHAGALTALIAGLEGSGKPLIHTSGSSVVSDTANGEASDAIFTEDTPVAPTPDKLARFKIDAMVRGAAQRDVRSVVICNCLIYGHGLGAHRDSIQLPSLWRQAAKSGVARHVGRGLNRWSTIHIEDVASLYEAALERAPAGFYTFAESGEARFRDLTSALARKMNVRGPEDWPIEEAIAEWGYEYAVYALGSNSRVRSTVASRLGWRPKREGVLDWIASAEL
jgi:nucleoside-diphosphate-sugar epimerase